MQEFIEAARQNLPLLSGLSAPLMQAINKNDPEELQHIFRCAAAHSEPCKPSLQSLKNLPSTLRRLHAEQQRCTDLQTSLAHARPV